MKKTKEKKRKKPKKRWHVWFGKLCRYSLIPVGLQVETDYPVMEEPPEADIIIIRRNRVRWTKKQLEVLPDGIRQSKARHILLELKYTESLNDEKFFQAGGYYKFYKDSNNLKKEEVDVFMVSSKTPSKKFMKAFGYKKTILPGVLKSKIPCFRVIPLISLNDLSDKPYNVMFKLFASKKKQQYQASKNVETRIIEKKYPDDLNTFFYDFFKILFNEGEKEMDWILLPEEEKKKIKLSIEASILKGMSRENRLDFLEQCDTEDRLRGIAPKDILREIDPKDILREIAPKDRLKGLKPEEFDIIEAYLKNMKRKRG